MGDFVLRLKMYIEAKMRAFLPLSVFFSARPDLFVGIPRWRWLIRHRRLGVALEPSIQIRKSRSLDIDQAFLIAEGVAIDAGVIIWLSNDEDSEASINLSESVYIGPYSFLGSNAQLSVGKDTLIGGHSYLITANHGTQDSAVPISEQGYTSRSITIGRNCWLGAHVVVLPGVTIGDRAVIGAGSVVTKDVPSGETWVGVPAKRIS